MKFILMFLITVLLTHCNLASKTKQIQKCSTAISGTMLSGHRWHHREAGIFEGKSSVKKPLLGALLKTEKNGIQFDRKDQVQIKFPSKYYPFDNLRCVVNEYGEIIFGKIPKKYCLIQSVIFEFVDITDINTKEPIRLELKANESFYYCIEPGEYKLIDMKITAIEDNEFSPIILPEIKFIAQENMNNCLGNILFDLSDVADSNTRILPYRWKEPFFKLPENVGIAFNPSGKITFSYKIFGKIPVEQKEDEEIELDGIHVLSNSEPDLLNVFNPNQLPVVDAFLEIAPHESENEIKAYAVQKGLDSYK